MEEFMRVQNGSHSVFEAVRRMENADQMEMVTIGKLFPSQLNPRQHFERIEELALSIHSQTQYDEGGEVRSAGVVVPLIVRPIGERYEVVAGERRYRALRKLIDGFDFSIDACDPNFSRKWIQVPEDYPVPVLVRNLTDSEVIELAVVENSHRQDLSFLEKSDVLMEWCEAGLSERKMAEKLGVCINTVRSYLLIGRRLCIKARYMLEKGEINMSQAKVLASVDYPLYETLLESGMSASQMRSVSGVAAFTIENAIFDIELSGLKIEGQFLGSFAERKFEDQHAAMAAQIDALNHRAEKIKIEDPDSWCEVICIDDNPKILPEEYQVEGTTRKGVVLVCNTLTGEISEFCGVYKVRAEKKKKKHIRPKKRSMEKTGSRDVSRAARDLEKAELEARHHANIDEMMVAPRIALAHAVVTIFDNAKVDQSASANKELINMLAEIHPNLFSVVNGLLKRITNKADLFTSLRSWSIPALAELLVYLTSGQVKDVMYSKAITLALSECKDGK